MKRAAALFFSILILFFSFSSCSNKKSSSTSCRDVIIALTSCEVGLPAGSIYCLTAEYGSDEYLTDSLISSLLGNGKMPEICESWVDAAFFLALKDHPCEFAVIRCHDRDAAIDTAKLLAARLASSRLVKGDSDYFDDASVTVIGSFALLIISSDRDKALKIAKSLLPY